MTCCTAPAASFEAKPAPATIGSYLDFASTANLPVKLRHAGWELGAGFHITEIKHTTVRGLDCGRNEEAWDETVVQLLDLPGPEEGRMKSAKFASILGHKQLQGELVFEISRPGEALALYQVAAVDAQPEALVVHLAPRAAHCKPATRASAGNLAGQAGDACCGGTAKAKGQCCA
ncbi:MAG: hypothetical protein KGO53_11725 [Alphaproteobacteria bacterium]|nr:hypothetical protein [Alphaproteobacteria bacterium]